MKLRSISVLTVSAAMLAACGIPVTSTQPPVQREQLQAVNDAAGRTLTCTAGVDCDTKWQRAAEWISRNSVYSIKTQSATLIETYGPLEPTTDSAFTVTRAPAGDGSAAITFSSTCGKTRNCVPTATLLKANFINYLTN